MMMNNGAAFWHFDWFLHAELTRTLNLALRFYRTKEWELENNTHLNPFFYLIKSSEIMFIFLPAFYLIIWLMPSPKNFEKISILKIWQLVFYWNVKICFGKFLPKWCIFRHGKILFSQIMPFNSNYSHLM